MYKHHTTDEEMNSPTYEHDDTDSFVSESTISSFDEKAKKILRFYPSNNHDAIIVHARTGEKYPWKVGSFESLRLFRICNTTGEYDEEGKIIKRGSSPNRNPNFLYYDSPEDYEEHWMTYLPHDMVTRWHDRVKLLFPGGEFSQKNYKEFAASYAAAVTKPDHTIAEQKRLEYERHVAKFHTEHPEYVSGKTARKGVRDDVLDIIIPGSTPAVGKSMKSRRTNYNESGGAYIS